MIMVIHVRKESGGKYFAGRSPEGMGTDFIPPENVFTIKQNKGESVLNFEERVRQEARRRGIEHVERLD